MQPIDILTKEFRNKKYKVSSVNSKKFKIIIPGGLDFNKTRSEIFNAVILLKPQIKTEITIVVEQLNSQEMKIS